MGRTGIAIMRAIMAGEPDLIRLAALRSNRYRKSSEQFAKYLTRGLRRAVAWEDLRPALR